MLFWVTSVTTHHGGPGSTLTTGRRKPTGGPQYLPLARLRPLPLFRNLNGLPNVWVTAKPLHQGAKIANLLQSLLHTLVLEMT